MRYPWLSQSEWDTVAAEAEKFIRDERSFKSFGRLERRSPTGRKLQTVNDSLTRNRPTIAMPLRLPAGTLFPPNG
jgi:hypothetical protein